MWNPNIRLMSTMINDRNNVCVKLELFFKLDPFFSNVVLMNIFFFLCCSRNLWDSRPSRGPWWEPACIQCPVADDRKRETGQNHLLRLVCGLAWLLLSRPFVKDEQVGHWQCWVIDTNKDGTPTQSRNELERSEVRVLPSCDGEAEQQCEVSAHTIAWLVTTRARQSWHFAPFLEKQTIKSKLDISVIRAWYN